MGPLSLSKGCDYAMALRRTTLDFTQDISPLLDLAYRGRDTFSNQEMKTDFFPSGENPAVVTDATCYMGWIADQYGLKLPRSYKVKSSCSQHTGDRNDVNKEMCW